MYPYLSLSASVLLRTTVEYRTPTSHEILPHRHGMSVNMCMSSSSPYRIDGVYMHHAEAASRCPWIYYGYLLDIIINYQPQRFTCSGPHP